MYQSVLKIITLSLMLFCNAISLSMEVVDAPKFGAQNFFDTQKLSTDLQRHIFVVAHPSIKNQLKICSKSWHAIGVKKAPNMYQLVNNSSFRASRDDWCYIMMHAALDKNVGMMRTILERAEQRNFDYDFGINYLGNHNKEQSFRFCDVCDLDWLRINCTDEEFKEFDLTSNANKHKINFETRMFQACFVGDLDIIQQLKVNRSTLHFYDCIVIAIYNDNPYCIEMLSSEVNHIVHDRLHLSLLRLAMRENKKHAFKALVENNVYTRLNDPVGIHMGQNTTIMDELLEQKDISDLQEYVTLYKQLGGKTWQEVTYAEEENKSQLAFMTFCPIF